MVREKLSFLLPLFEQTDRQNKTKIKSKREHRKRTKKRRITHDSTQTTHTKRKLIIQKIFGQKFTHIDSIRSTVFFFYCNGAGTIYIQ